MIPSIAKPTRKEALTQRLRWYYGKVCPKHPDLHGERRLSNGTCANCEREAKSPARSRAWYVKNAEMVKQRSRQWYANNRAKARQTQRQWYDKNKEKALRRSHQWYTDNTERTRCLNLRWRSENPHARAFLSRKYRAAKLNRIPHWLTPDDFKTIEMFYEAAAHFTTVTGVKYAVDHYYPLQGKTVSGLHVPANLQVIPSALNVRKGNKHPDEFRR